MEVGLWRWGHGGGGVAVGAWRWERGGGSVGVRGCGCGDLEGRVAGMARMWGNNDTGVVLTCRTQWPN